jgi:hypothetical protein
MNTQEKLRTAAGIETVILGLLIASIAFLGIEEAEAYRLYEFLGVVMATIITTYGIYKMRALT